MLKDRANVDRINDLKSCLLVYKETNGKSNPGTSIYATSLPALRDLATIQLAKAEKTVGIDDIVRHKGKIFMLNNPACDVEEEGAFALMVSAFLMGINSLPDVAKGELRAFVLLDEALTLKMPKKIELAVYTICRRKGLAIIVAAQRLPDKNLSEIGVWATVKNQMIVMKSKDVLTGEFLSKKKGTLVYDEKQESVS